MRIAFYAPMKPPDHPVPSGDRRMARLLIAALHAGGHDVRLAARLRSWDDGRIPGRPARLRALGGRIAGRLIRRWRDAADRPDLWFTYHLYHKAPDWLGPAVCDGLVIPYVVAEASYAPRRRTGPWAEGLAATAAAIRRADAVLALSAEDAECLGPLVAAPERLRRLPPFLDTAPFAAAAADRAAARARWWQDEPGPWLLAVGMMREGDKARSFAVLAEAMARLAAAGLPDGPRWRLALAGDGPAREAIQAGFARLPEAGKRVRWLGQIAPEALPSLYAAADLLVWPAINEAYGMALLEAQAAGLPVVAGRTGGVPEIVRDGITGVLTPPGDAAVFAGAVAGLLADPARRAAMGAAAAAVAAAEHGFESAAARLSALVEDVRAGTSA